MSTTDPNTTSEAIEVHLLPIPSETLTPAAARAWIADELPRWFEAMRSAVMAVVAPSNPTEPRANAACSLIDDVEALTLACARALATGEPVVLEDAGRGNDETSAALAHVLAMLLGREAGERLVFEPSNPALSLAERLASLRAA